MNNTREKVATTAGKVSDTKFSLKDGKVHIFPFIIRNGYQNVTEVGFVPKGENPYWYSFFQKVFTGRETITATWEDSTKLNVRDASLGTYNYDFQVGKYYEGMIVPGSHTQTMEISDVNGNDGFLAMQESGDITILFSRNELDNEPTDFIPTEEDLFKLYIIPESNFQNKWLYISNVTTYNNPKNKANILTEVTFSSLKDKLETSGRALEQYVQYAAPGEPYAFPYITMDNEVIVSPLRISEYWNQQVKYLQVELQGANAFSSVTVFGRRLYWDDVNHKWYTSPSKFLLPYKFFNPQTNPLNKTSSPSKNFYCFPDETIETRSTSDWLKAIKEQDNQLSPQQNMGSFTMSGTWIDGVHQSNALVDGKHIDYFDTSWKPLQGRGNITVQTKGNVYCSDNVVYTQNDTMQQVLIKNAMCNLTQLELPLDMKQTRPYRWSNLPIIGFWTRWFGDRAVWKNTTQVKTNHICYFIDTNLATMQYNAFVQPPNNPSYGNLQMFNGEDAPSMLNPQSGNTTICFELSDTVSFTDAKYNDNAEHPRPLANGIDTVYFSQKKDEYGVNLHNDGTALVLNCEDSNINVKHCEYSFIIDYVVVNALHIGKVKVSTYSASTNNNLSTPLFTQTVLSNSMFESNNIRNWTTDITLGTWDENWSDGEITWPLEPQKEIVGATEINVVGRDINGTFGKNNEKLYNVNDQSGQTHKFNWANSLADMRATNTVKTGWTNVLKEESIPYQQIKSTYTDRATFISLVNSIQFDVTGSILEGRNGGSTSKCNLNGKFIDIDLDELKSPTYTLTKTYTIGYLGSDGTKPCLDQKLATLNPYVISNATFHPFVTATNSGNWSQDVEITITLESDALYYKIIEKTNYVSYINMQKFEENSYDDVTVGYINNEGAYCRSQIKIPRIKLIEK